MGNCCPTDNTDTNASKSAAKASVSPNSKRKQKQGAEVSPFRPGPRGVRVTQDEDGNF